MKKKEEKENVNCDIETMTQERIDICLADLAESASWKALLQTMRTKDYQTIGTLATVDPFKNPTEVARSQGIRMGLYFVENEVAKAKERIDKKKEK